MLAFLGALLGFLGSLAPEGLKLVQDKRDKEHELAMMQLQIQAQKDGVVAKIEEVQTSAFAQEMVAIQESYQKELQYSGKFAASVRPTITYLLTIMYLFQKSCVLYVLINSPFPWQHASSWVEAALLTWTAFDELLLSSVVGFWFGGRLFSKKP